MNSIYCFQQVTSFRYIVLVLNNEVDHCENQRDLKSTDAGNLILETRKVITTFQTHTHCILSYNVKIPTVLFL